MKRSLLFVAVGFFGCSPSLELSVTFVEETSGGSASYVALTAVEPLIDDEHTLIADILRCEEIGSFVPTRLVDPALPARHGALVLHEREVLEFPPDDAYSIDARPRDEDRNPWGAALLHVETLGSYDAGGEGLTPVAAGCVCVRVRDTVDVTLSYSDWIINNCQLVDEVDQVEVPLRSLLPDSFNTVPQDTAVTLSPNSRGSGAPLALVPTMCQRTKEEDCYRCFTSGCDELDQQEGVPVRYELEGTDIEQLVVTSPDGLARASLPIETCPANELTLTAMVLGRPDTTTDFSVTCVPPVTGWSERSLQLHSSDQAIDATTLEGTDGDAVVVLHDATDSFAEVLFAPHRADGVKQRIEVGERLLAAHGFAPDHLAIVSTSTTDTLQLLLFERDTATSLTPVGRLPLFCGSSVCATQGSCAIQPGFNSSVLLTSRDLDRDGKPDLLVATPDAIDFIAFYSDQVPSGSNDLFVRDGCTCGRLATGASQITLANFGGRNEDPSPINYDLAVTTASGLYLTYFNPGGLPCSNGDHFGGDLSTAYDLGTGTFNDHGYEDLITVSADSVMGGSQDRGVLRLIYGAPEGIVEELEDALHRSSTVWISGSPLQPKAVQVGDFNGDGLDDAAVLYAGTQEIRILLGGKNGTLAESNASIALKSDCIVETFAVGDADNDGIDEIAIVCDQKLSLFFPQS